MLEEIRIKNLGVIDSAVLPLGRGFTALTGETGAGKTMIITALGLLLGARADSGVVRSQAELANVDGVWILPETSPAVEHARDLGADLTALAGGETEMIINRSLSSQGRSKSFIGGRALPVQSLGELGEYLVTVHGQADQLRLKSAAQQRETLDLFAGSEHLALLDGYQRNFKQWQETRSELEELRLQAEQRLAEAETLREALEDFERLAPEPGEDIQLQQRAEALEHSEELRASVSESYEYLRSEDNSEFSILSRLNSSKRGIERAATLDSTLQTHLQTLNELELALGDVASELAHYLLENDGDTVAELEQVQARRSELNRLGRKYGGTLDEAISYSLGASDRLLELDQTGDQIEHLAAQESALLALLGDQAAQLSQNRSQSAELLSSRVTAELTALAMPNARLMIAVEALSELGSAGADTIQFLLIPHPGAEARPIAKGASGGELSRIMLAIEVVLAEVDPVPTLIFDEIDAGVGGAAALEIGRRLARLSEHSQVIVVTHLAQVAAFANQHVQITKSSTDGSTVSNIRELSGSERTAEIARLLSGHPDSENALAHAKELLESAKIG
ncbi:MAG: DNA repair protein RecN [Microbacteriaceae bacterium]